MGNRVRGTGAFPCLAAAMLLAAPAAADDSFAQTDKAGGARPLGQGRSAGPDANAGPLSVVSVLHHEEAFSRPHDIQLQRRLAFVPGKGGSVAVVDVADPEGPRLLWWKRDPDSLDDSQTVLPLGRYLLLGGRHFDVIDLEELQSALNDGRREEDLGDPVFARRVSERPRIDRINGMVRRGDFVLSANKNGWVAVFDIREPAEATLVDALNTRQRGGLVSPHDIAAWKDYIAVVDQSGGSRVQLRLYRVADPRTHRLLPSDEWEIAGAAGRDDMRGANRVVIADGYAYVACSQGGNFALGFFDVRDPAEPRHLKTLPFADVHPTGLTIAGDVLFAAGGRAIEALDVSAPAEPRVLAVLESRKLFPTGRDNAHDLVYRGGYLYVTAQNDSRIGIVRVNDRGILRLIGEGR